MTKQTINVGTSPNDNKGDSLRASFQKINANFTELYTALGINADVNLNIGAFEFTGSVLSTTDSSAIVIDQATTITSNLTVGGDLLPSVANGGDLGSAARPWRSLYVSNSTIYLGGVPLTVDADNNLTVNGSPVTGGSVSSLVNGANTVSLESTGALTLPNDSGNGDPILTIQGGANPGILSDAGGGPGNFNITAGQLLIAGSSGAITLTPDDGEIKTGADMVLTTNGNAEPIQWIFGTNGNLTLPTNTSAINYANGAPFNGGGVSLVPNMVTYGNGSLYGNSNPGFTVVDGLEDDDDSYSIPVDFPLEFLGNNYSSGNVRLVSNGYLTFGPDSYDDYHPVGPGIVPVPAIYMGALDLSLQKYYYGYADGTDIFVIGYEGSIDTSGEENYPAIKWELQVNSATPDQLLLVMDGPGNEGASLNFPGGVWGLSNGEKWVDQFQPLPWYSNYADTTYNAITVAPVTPVAASTIAFVGPGVTIGADGGTTYVNIDPFDNAIDVGYDDDTNDAVISSVYYGLKLTTAQNGEDITIAPLGDVQIQGGDRSSNQPGSGYDVEIRGGNAIDDPSTPGQNFNGGDIQLRGGAKVGNGTPGTIQLYTNSNINQWLFDGTGNLTLPGDIKSNGNINIEINLSDSTLRRWQFGEDGALTFPDATVQTTAWAGIPGPYADDSAAATAGVAVGYPYHKTGTGGQVFVRLS